jgi:hypothetical protein
VKETLPPLMSGVGAWLLARDWVVCIRRSPNGRPRLSLGAATPAVCSAA